MMNETKTEKDQARLAARRQTIIIEPSAMSPARKDRLKRNRFNTIAGGVYVQLDILVGLLEELELDSCEEKHIESCLHEAFFKIQYSGYL